MSTGSMWCSIEWGKVQCWGLEGGGPFNDGPRGLIRSVSSLILSNPLSSPLSTAARPIEAWSGAMQLIGLDLVQGPSALTGR